MLLISISDIISEPTCVNTTIIEKKNLLKMYKIHCRLIEVGTLETPKLQGKYDTGQVTKKT